MMMTMMTCQFQWWRKPEHPEETGVTDKLSHTVFAQCQDWTWAAAVWNRLQSNALAHWATEAPRGKWSLTPSVVSEPWYLAIYSYGTKKSVFQTIFAVPMKLSFINIDCKLRTITLILDEKWGISCGTLGGQPRSFSRANLHPTQVIRPNPTFTAYEQKIHQRTI